MKWVKSAIARLVYDERLALVPASRQAEWPQRMFLKRFLKRLSIDCVLDVGANVGQYARELRRIGYAGHIISFEPDPSCFEALLASSKSDPKWEALNLALGNEAGQANLNRMAVSLFNSFRSPMSSETDRFAGANEIVGSVTVEVARLSDIFEGLRSKHRFRNTFLKMDTQGFDSEVFAGASGIVDDIRGMQSEVGMKRLYEGVNQWSHQIEAYRNAGFDLAGIFAVNPGDDALVEFDCYFQRIC